MADRAEPVAAAPVRARDDGPLLERAAALSTLADAIDRAASGTGSITTITGASGIGKTRLLREAQDAAARAGFTVLAARGGELEQEYPFGIVRQLFERPLAASGAARRWLDGPARAAASVFAVDGTADATAARFPVLHGLYWLAANASESAPLMLAIDDLQWADAASLRFLAYLAVRLRELPVLVVVALRPTERAAPTGAAGSLFTAIDAEAAGSIRPRALSAAAVTQLITAGLRAQPAPAFAAAFNRATGGNPLLATELLRTLRAEHVAPSAQNVAAIQASGPSAVARGVLLRLEGLHPSAVEVARSVAILGEAADFDAVAALAGLDRPSLSSAIGALVRAGILAPSPTPSFVHPLVREAVYRELAVPDRQDRHARAAQLLRESGAPEARVASQLLAAPPRAQGWVVDMLRTAARSALHGGAVESAVAYLRRALREPPVPDDRVEVLHELAIAESLVDVPAAVDHLEQAHALARTPREVVAASDLLARLLLFSRSGAEAAQAARNGARRLPPELTDERRMLSAVELYAVHFGAPDNATAQRLEAAAADAHGRGLGARSLLAVAAWDRALTGGSAVQCADTALEALSGDELIRSDPALMSLVAASVLVLADRDEAVSVCERALASARRHGSLFAVTGIHQVQGWSWLARGELAEAEQCLRNALEDETALHEATWNPGTPYDRAFLAEVLLERGELVAARAQLAAAGSPAPGSDADALCRRVRIRLQLASGRYPQAAAAAARAAQAGRIVNPAWAPWRSLQARALIAQGRGARAAELLRDELRSAQAWGAPGVLGRVLRLLGQAHRGRAGLDVLEEAVRTTDDTPVLLEHSKCQAAWGAALSDAGFAADAAAPLRGALESALRCGATPLVQRVREALAAVPGASPSDHDPEVTALSPSERRVADLAAAGCTNRQIAQELYITTKTVEAHLSHTYRKLGIRARDQLDEALRTLPARAGTPPRR